MIRPVLADSQLSPPFLKLLAAGPDQVPAGRCSARRVYETRLRINVTFRKLAGGMSFVNSLSGAFPGLGKQDYGGSGEVQPLPALSGFCLFT